MRSGASHSLSHTHLFPQAGESQSLVPLLISRDAHFMCLYGCRLCLVLKPQSFALILLLLQSSPEGKTEEYEEYCSWEREEEQRKEKTLNPLWIEMRSAYINRGVRSASPPAPLPLLSSASLDFSVNLGIFRDAFKSFKSIGCIWTLPQPQKIKHGNMFTYSRPEEVNWSSARSPPRVFPALPCDEFMQQRAGE